MYLFTKSSKGTLNSMAVDRKFWSSSFNFERVYPEIDVFSHLYHKQGNEKNPRNVKVSRIWLYTALMCTTYPWIWTHVKGAVYSTVWRLNHLQIIRMTIYIVYYIYFLFPILEEGAIIVLARQHHRKFNVSYAATINLVYNLRKQNMIRNLKQQWTRYMFHKCCCKP